MSAAVYTRVAHGAHCNFDGSPLYDLERWDVAQPYNAPRPADVPDNAEQHHGYLDNGVQRVVFVRTAPVTPCVDCKTCARVAAIKLSRGGK